MYLLPSGLIQIWFKPEGTYPSAERNPWQYTQKGNMNRLSCKNLDIFHTCSETAMVNCKFKV